MQIYLMVSAWISKLNHIMENAQLDTVCILQVWEACFKAYADLYFAYILKFGYFQDMNVTEWKPWWYAFVTYDLNL